MWFLLAPGAGAPSTSPWMMRWRALLTTLGPVETLDYPYQIAGKKRPDTLERLIDAHGRALEAARARHPTDEPVVLVGKSMGSRVGCHLAARSPVAAVVCLGYPLVPPGRAGPLRDQALLEASAPLLLLQGTRDPLCPLEPLREVLRKRKRPTELVVVESGDHSLETTKTHQRRAGIDQATSDAALLHRMSDFLTKTVG